MLRSWGRRSYFINLSFLFNLQHSLLLSTSILDEISRLFLSRPCVFKVLFIGTSSSPLLTETSNRRLRLKPKKWSMTLPSGLWASSMTQAQRKSSVTMAIPSAWTLTTRRTNQVGFSFFWSGVRDLGDWLSDTLFSGIWNIYALCVTTVLELGIKVVFD